jgi:hypothetical protein
VAIGVAEVAVAARAPGAGAVEAVKVAAESVSASRADRGQVATPTRWRLNLRKMQSRPVTRSRAKQIAPRVRWALGSCDETQPDSVALIGRSRRPLVDSR